MLFPQKLSEKKRLDIEEPPAGACVYVDVYKNKKVSKKKKSLRSSIPISH
jgi:hypothetical protein